MGIISELTPGVKNTVKWVALGLFAIAASIGIWKVSSFIKDLRESEAKVTRAETNEKIAIANRDGLKEALDEINKNLLEIKEKNLELEKRVKESAVRIKKISDKTDETLAALDKEVLPTGCEDQFAWMLDKALKKKREHEKSN